MEFGNPIVGGEDLIRESIKSPDFTPDSENGVTGWQISRDGSATFYNLIIGSQNYFVDELGNASFNSISTDSITLGGSDLQAFLNTLPYGTIAYGFIASGTNTASIAGTETMCFISRAGQVKQGRLYRITVKGHLGYSAADTPFDIRLRYTADGNDPTTSSSIFTTYRAPGAPSSVASEDFNIVKYYSPGSDFDDLRFGISLVRAGGTGTAFIYQGTSERGLEIGVDDMGLYGLVSNGAFSQVSLASGSPSAPPPTTYVKTYSANWSGSYQSDGDNRNVSECYQGYYSGTNGNQYSLVGLPYATIQADLSGATITKTEIYLNNNHFYSNSGGTAYVGTHTYASEPTTASLSNVSERLDSETFTYGQAKWFTVTNTIGNNLKNNSAKGIAIGPGPSNSQSYYAYFAGNGQSGEPQIRITYKK